MKQNCYYRIILLVVIQFFVFLGFVFSSSTILTDLKIPSQIGSIKEIFENNLLGPSSAPTIIQIQDAHCNYEAQKNLATILEYLIKEKNVKLVLVEGGSGNVTLSFLRAYAEKKDRELIADKYLRSGKISGEEYLDIVSDYNFELYGIENPTLYESNLDSFLNIESYRDNALKDIAGLRKIVEALKPRVYSSELRDFEDKETKYENKEVSLANYAAYIKEKALEKELGMDDYQQIVFFLKSLGLEKELDFKEAEKQRGIFIKDLAGKMAESEVKELIARTQEFKAQKILSSEYYGFLKNKAEGKLDLRQDYPQLASYMSYAELGPQIKPEALLEELRLLSGKLKDIIFVSADEKELYRVSAGLFTLEHFLKLDLTPRDYDEFTADQEKLKTASWIDFLKRNCRKYGIGESPEAAASIDDNIDKFNDFYRIGLQREQSFMKNIADKMAASGDKVAVVITGGFHTSGMSKLFKDNGYSYAVVTPAITERADPAIYYSVLRGDKGEIEDTYLEDAYSEEN